jgi:hypothetical protein
MVMHALQSCDFPKQHIISTSADEVKAIEDGERGCFVIPLKNSKYKPGHILAFERTTWNHRANTPTKQYVCRTVDEVFAFGSLDALLNYLILNELVTQCGPTVNSIRDRFQWIKVEECMLLTLEPIANVKH